MSRTSRGAHQAPLIAHQHHGSDRGTDLARPASVRERDDSSLANVSAINKPQLFTPKDPYRPLEHGAQRVAFYEPSYVRGRCPSIAQASAQAVEQAASEAVEKR